MASTMEHTSRWMSARGPASDTVLSARVRIARNIKGYPFPGLASDDTSGEVRDRVSEAIKLEKMTAEYSWQHLENISTLEKEACLDRHLISPFLAREAKMAALALSRDEALGVLVNEEDHLRIQAILPGLQLEEALRSAAQLDDLLEEALGFAFDEKLGYLTACPTNLGTGLRASVMLHLPALVSTGQIRRYLGALPRIGFTIRGLYGEGSEIAGNLLQVSNQITLGQSEEEGVANLHCIVNRIIEQEQKARQKLLDRKRDAIADSAYRALGLLRYARVMSSTEAMELLSDLRLGCEMGLVREVDSSAVNRLMVVSRPGYLQMLKGREMSSEERDLERPLQMRKYLDD